MDEAKAPGKVVTYLSRQLEGPRTSAKDHEALIKELKKLGVTLHVVDETTPWLEHMNAVVRSSLFSPTDFAQLFIELVGKDHTLEMAKDDGAFVVAVLCERAAESDNLKKTLKSWFPSSVVKELETEKDKRGRKVLLEQIVALS